MSRPNKPWYRATSDAWVVKLNGRQYTLARGKGSRREATKAFHTLMVSLGRVEAAPGDLGVGALFDHFLDAAEVRVVAKSLSNYREWLVRFRDHVEAHRLVSRLTPADVDRWFLGKGWSPSTREMAISIVRRALGWGVKQGLIAVNPLRDVKGPGFQQRDTVFAPGQVSVILEATRGGFRDLLEFMHETGCRPSEAQRLEGVHCHLAEGVARMPGKTSRATGKLRTIYLTPRAIEILATQIEERPTGVLFVNEGGAAWKPQALHGRLVRLRKRLGMGSELTPEAFRHTYGTDAALRLKGAVLAELMGHSSSKMCDRYYVHLNKRSAEMRAAALEVRSPPERLAIEPAD